MTIVNPTRDPEATLEAMSVALARFFDWTRAIEHDTDNERALPYLGDALTHLESAKGDVAAALAAMTEQRENGK